MEAKRKTLYPVMRRYAQNPQNHVVMVRDKLFINSEQYIPPTESNETADGQLQNRPSEVNSRGGERLNAGGRRFAQGIRARQQAQYNGVRTFNYYANLSVEQSDPTAEQMRGGKRALSSPEQDDTALKRSRELRAVPLCSIEDTEEMEILQGPGTDPGSVAQQTATADSIQLDVSSQPGTSSDSNAVNTVNTQTITVDFTILRAQRTKQTVLTVKTRLRTRRINRTTREGVLTIKRSAKTILNKHCNFSR